MEEWGRTLRLSYLESNYVTGYPEMSDERLPNESHKALFYV